MQQTMDKQYSINQVVEMMESYGRLVRACTVLQASKERGEPKDVQKIIEEYIKEDLIPNDYYKWVPEEVQMIIFNHGMDPTDSIDTDSIDSRCYK